MKALTAEHARIEDISAVEILPPAVRDEFARHLEHFARPSDENLPCLKCGKHQVHYFRWGLQHGVGNCSGCGWPARLYHFVKDAEGQETRIVRLLQYHPDYVGPKRKKASQNKASEGGLE